MKTIQLYDESLLTEIKNLPYSDTISNNTDGILIPESDYGFAEIYRMYDDILVFLIPQYGGTPSFYESYSLHSIDNLIKDLKQIT